MNKVNGIREQASVSTSLYSKEHNCKHRSSSGFPTFLKWFKKGEKHDKSVNGGVSSKCSQLSDSHDTLSPPSSPFLDNLSPSSSCDSVLSTSTTGFAFVKPQNYRRYNFFEDPQNFIASNPETDSYRRRLNNFTRDDEGAHVTLREKYFLYDTDTLKSNELNESNYDNVRFIDRSLPNTRKKSSHDTQIIRNRHRHRRAVSDSSKDKKSGAYVHVKGKRRAPPPPSTAANELNNISDNNISVEIYSPTSTLGRKKRKAPPPPQAPKSPTEDIHTSILSEGLLDDKEIQAIIGCTRIETQKSTTDTKMFSKSISVECDNPSSTDKFTPLNGENATCESTSEKNETGNKSPGSSLYPKPWYKRPNSSNRDSLIPFKREVVLRTMEKRKSKHREKDSQASSMLPEVGYSRSNMFDSAYKLGFFMRHKDNSNENKSKDKRRSGIGIPNISELDREAAEIVNKEHASEKAKQKAEQDKFFNPPEHLVLQQQMFGSTKSEESSQCDGEDENAVSTKELISKFESTSNIARITLNTSFIGRTEHFFPNPAKEDKYADDDKQMTSSNSKEETNKSSENTQKSSPIFSNLGLTQDGEKTESKPMSIEKEINQTKVHCSSDIKANWSCPFCTLENPYWRIICEACERLKPYDKSNNKDAKPAIKLSAKIDPLPNPLSQKNDVPNPPLLQDTKMINEVNKFVADDKKFTSPLSQQLDWEKKAEKVRKYFMPRNANNALSKSSSETTVVKKPPVFRKSPSPSRLPIISPKFCRKNKLYNVESKPTIVSPTTTRDRKQFGNDERKLPLLDSSVIITTITPVFFASTTVVNQPKQAELSPPDENQLANGLNLKEIRTARLAKFSIKPQNRDECKIEEQISSNQDRSNVENLSGNDADSLEREKKRLREKIRAMNAKALAEKYPVLQKPLPRTEAVEKDHNSTKHGAIKKVFKKNLSPFSKPIDKFPESIGDDYGGMGKYPKPKKVSTSVQTAGFVKKNELKDGSKEQLSDNVNEDIKLDNVYQEVLYRSPRTYNQHIFKDPIKENSSNSIYDKVKVEEISQQLQSTQGIIEFKETLSNPTKGISRTDTIALNKIMRNLELAISEGQDERAANIAMDLAKMKVSLQVTKVKNRPVSGSMDYNQSIIVDVFVEDKMTQKGPIQMSVKPLMTILELKEKALRDFDIPVDLQKWLINDEPAIDHNKTLLEYGVKDSTTGFYLYLITPQEKYEEQAELTVPIPKTSIAVPEDMDDVSDGDSDSYNELDQIMDDGANGLPLVEENPTKNTWRCPLCTLINSEEVLACAACSKAKPKACSESFQKQIVTISEELKQFLGGNQTQIVYRSAEQKNDLNKANPFRKSSEIFNIVENVLLEPIPLGISVLEENRMLPKFTSPNITKNKYRGVDNYNPNRKRTDIPVKKDKSRAPLPPNLPKVSHYQELLQLDHTDAVPNVEEFVCPICFMNFQPGEGVILRECLHSFCKECLGSTVKYSEEAEVKCPYMDVEYSCSCILQDREIKSIVSHEVYEQHLAKSIRVAEHQIENAFHCKTPNCRGWCIYEDNVNEFKCPVCRITNCLMCRVIHDGLTCKQYQDRLNSDCDSNIEARRTKDMINEMVEKGEAMNCPTCQVIMMKKWGCDWLKCSMCKTEVCWVTRGPRWGPGGKGDNTGGCKCGVDGKKCHPKCNYCH